MRRADWTPLVLVTASISVTVVAAVLLTTPWLRGPWGGEPGPGHARRRLDETMQVWTGDLAPGVVGVLAPVWGQDGPDREHDRVLGEQLHLPEGRHLAWYHLLLFNRSEEDREVSLADGALRIRSAVGEGPVGLTSLARLVARGEARVAPSLAAVLHARGALSETVTLPGGWMADLLVAFERRVPLKDAAVVERADGEPFTRRPMTRRELDRLVEDPDAALLEDL